jgi:hypothetical protein
MRLLNVRSHRAGYVVAMVVVCGVLLDFLIAYGFLRI